MGAAKQPRIIVHVISRSARVAMLLDAAAIVKRAGANQDRQSPERLSLRLVVETLQVNWSHFSKQERAGADWKLSTDSPDG